MDFVKWPFHRFWCIFFNKRLKGSFKVANNNNNVMLTELYDGGEWIVIYKEVIVSRSIFFRVYGSNIFQGHEVFQILD